MAAKRRNPAIVIALALLLAIVVAVPVAATIPAVDIGAGDLELVATSPTSSPLLAPAELSISLPPPGHAPPALALEDASDHHFRIALAIAFARAEAKNRIRGRAAFGSIQLFGNMEFKVDLAPGVRNSPSMYQGFNSSPLNYGDPMGLCIGPWNELTCGEFGASFVGPAAHSRFSAFMTGYVRTPANFVIEELPTAFGGLFQTIESNPRKALEWPGLQAMLAMDAISFPGRTLANLADGAKRSFAGFLNSSPYDQGTTSSFVAIDAATAAKGVSLTLARRKLLRPRVAGVAVADKSFRMARSLRGKDVLNSRVIGRLSGFLDGHGVKLIIDDERLRREDAAGLFATSRDGTVAELVLGTSATYFEAIHELSHFFHWKEMSPEDFYDLSRVEAERRVLRSLKKPSRWKRLPISQRWEAEQYFGDVEIRDLIENGGG